MHQDSGPLVIPVMLTESECRDYAWRSFAFVVIDDKGIIHKTTPRLEVMFGYVRNELVGQPLETLVPPASRATHPSMRQGYFGNPTDRSMNKARIVSGVHKDGHVVPVIVTLTSFFEQHHQWAMAMVSEATVEEGLDQTTIQKNMKE